MKNFQSDTVFLYSLSDQVKINSINDGVESFHTNVVAFVVHDKKNVFSTVQAKKKNQNNNERWKKTKKHYEKYKL